MSRTLVVAEVVAVAWLASPLLQAHMAWPGQQAVLAGACALVKAPTLGTPWAKVSPLVSRQVL